MISLSQASTDSPTPLNISWGSAQSKIGWTSYAPHDTGAALAYPALVVGSDRLLTAVQPQLNAFFDPWTPPYDDHMGNFGFGPDWPPSLSEWLAPILPPPANSWTITQPQLLLDPVGGAYLLVVSATRPSDHSSLLVRAGQNFLGGRTAVALDLSNGQSMWMFGAYAAGNNANCQANGWGTWFGRVTW